MGRRVLLSLAEWFKLLKCMSSEFRRGPIQYRLSFLCGIVVLYSLWYCGVNSVWCCGPRRYSTGSELYGVNYVYCCTLGQLHTPCGHTCEAYAELPLYLHALCHKVGSKLRRIADSYSNQSETMLDSAFYGSDKPELEHATKLLLELMSVLAGMSNQITQHAHAMHTDAHTVIHPQLVLIQPRCT